MLLVYIAYHYISAAKCLRVGDRPQGIIIIPWLIITYHHNCHNHLPQSLAYKHRSYLHTPPWSGTLGHQNMGVSLKVKIYLLKLEFSTLRQNKINIAPILDTLLCSSMVFWFSKTFELFVFPVLRFWAYLMKVITEIRYQWFFFINVTVI